MKEKIVEFWKNHETKVVLLVGLILVALISFQGGYLKGRAMPESPLIIERSETQNNENISVNSDIQSTPTDKNEANLSQNKGTEENKNCAFVGSKNSNKYHLPACRYAKTIKLENLACFASKEDAEKRGYQPDTNCIK
ncbi:hypothetical protein KJ761_02330 [Patescibacteria group bacterium]|nr:hypothetical protein [Patescibacteria group bacterium]